MKYDPDALPSTAEALQVGLDAAVANERVEAYEARVARAVLLTALVADHSFADLLEDALARDNKRSAATALDELKEMTGA